MVKKSGRWHGRLDRLLAQSSYAELKDDRLGRASCRCHYSLQFQPSPSRKSNFRRPCSGPPEQTAAEQGFGLFGPRISRVLLHDHPSIIPASLSMHSRRRCFKRAGDPQDSILLGSRSCRSGIALTGESSLKIRGNTADLCAIFPSGSG